MKSDDVKIDTLSNNRRDYEKELREILPSYDNHTRQISHVLGEKPLRKGGVDQHSRILLAFGMAVAGGNESMIEFTVTRGVNHGVTMEMFLDALDVAILFGGGSVVSRARFALEAISYRFLKPQRSH
jgi:alkylhydroperoxidase/carboxymuconolactone decarboxylase family protein YurZ